MNRSRVFYLSIISVLLVTLYSIVSPSYTASAENKSCILDFCPTPIPRVKPTAIPSPTAMPSVTESVTPSPVPSITSTVTPIPSDSVTPTPTITPTAIPTPTGTSILAATSTPTPTPTSVVTATQTTQSTQTSQPTATPTPKQEVLGVTKGGQPVYTAATIKKTPQTGASELSLLMLIPSSLAGLFLRKKI